MQYRRKAEKERVKDRRTRDSTKDKKKIGEDEESDVCTPTRAVLITPRPGGWFYDYAGSRSSTAGLLPFIVSVKK